VSAETRKTVVRRLVTVVFNEGRLDVLDQLYQPGLIGPARAWIEQFRASFSDLEMTIVSLVADDDTVVVRATCSGTHTGPWLGHAPTYRRFRRVPEVYFFGFTGDFITHVWGLEDTHRRLHQLGLA
jgi:predicted ester cyclase